MSRKVVVTWKRVAGADGAHVDAGAGAGEEHVGTVRKVDGKLGDDYWAWCAWAYVRKGYGVERTREAARGRVEAWLGANVPKVIRTR